MRRKLSILLLFCFSFYHFGYYFLYFSYKYKIESDWAADIYTDQEFKKEHLIKIPLYIPYMPDQEGFHHTNASFEKNGKTYRIVKQRYASDTLQVVYVPDVALYKLDLAIKGWITALTDGVSQEASKGKILPKTFIKDYIQPGTAIYFRKQVSIAHVTPGFIPFSYPHILIELPDPPPEMFTV